MTGRIKEKSVFVILLPGNASEKIEEHLSDYEDMVEVSSMQEAVKTASELAKAGDLVVLSPAASSFNMFKNEFDRGNEFIKSVKSLE